MRRLVQFALVVLAVAGFLARAVAHAAPLIRSNVHNRRLAVKSVSCQPARYTRVLNYKVGSWHREGALTGNFPHEHVGIKATCAVMIKRSPGNPIVGIISQDRIFPVSICYPKGYRGAGGKLEMHSLLMCNQRTDGSFRTLAKSSLLHSGINPAEDWGRDLSSGGGRGLRQTLNLNTGGCACFGLTQVVEVQVKTNEKAYHCERSYSQNEDRCVANWTGAIQTAAILRQQIGPVKNIVAEAI